MRQAGVVEPPDEALEHQRVKQRRVFREARWRCVKEERVATTPREIRVAPRLVPVPMLGYVVGKLVSRLLETRQGAGSTDTKYLVRGGESGVKCRDRLCENGVGVLERSRKGQGERFSAITVRHREGWNDFERFVVEPNPLMSPPEVVVRVSSVYKGLSAQHRFDDGIATYPLPGSPSCVKALSLAFQGGDNPSIFQDQLPQAVFGVCDVVLGRWPRIRESRLEEPDAAAQPPYISSVEACFNRRNALQLKQGPPPRVSRLQAVNEVEGSLRILVTKFSRLLVYVGSGLR